MRAGSVNNAFKLYPKGSDTPVNATVSYAETTTETGTRVYKATLDPTDLLQRGTTYKAVLATGAKDLAGNRLDQDGNPSNGNQKKVWFTVRNAR